jgi:hypothetical protein
MKKSNVRLLRKIQKHIMAEPRRFCMDAYYFEAKNRADWLEEVDCHSDMAQSMPACKTAACIAGWAGLLSKDKHFLSVDRSADLLDISNPLTIRGLFFLSYWPEPFKRNYQQARTPLKRAKIACARIDHLIETGE